SRDAHSNPRCSDSSAYDSRPLRTRVLIITASVGEGHDLPARMLADQLEWERPGTEVVIEDGLAAMGRLFIAINEQAPRVIFYRLLWVFDVSFWVFARFPPTRAATK